MDTVIWDWTRVSSKVLYNGYFSDGTEDALIQYLNNLPLEQLSHMYNLAIHKCVLSCVPKHIFAAYDHLTELCLNGCALNTFPRQLECLRTLRILAMSDNQLMFIPRFVGRLENLRALDLSDNQLIHLPYEISKCPLEYLNLHGNPLNLCISFDDFLIGTSRVLRCIALQYHYQGATDAIVTILLILKHTRVLDTIGKNVIHHIIIPMLWESRDERIWARADDVAFCKSDDGK